MLYDYRCCILTAGCIPSAFPLETGLWIVNSDERDLANFYYLFGVDFMGY